MKQQLVLACFFLAGLVNLTPVLGVLGREDLETLYSTPIASSELLLLMQHRALMFGVPGALLLLATFQKKLRTIAAIIGMYSMVTYIILFVVANVQSDRLVSVAWADFLTIGILGLGWFLDRQLPVQSKIA